MHDLLPPQAALWRRSEEAFRRVFLSFGYREIRTPVVEHAEVFSKSVGEATDILEKEVYSFRDRGGRLLVLRPEGTAPVVRAFIEHLQSEPHPLRLFYLNLPMFRHDRPEAGRYRQFHQSGAEILGSDHPAADAETVILSLSLLEALGIGETEVLLNTLGCPECRPGFIQRLRGFYAGKEGLLCPDCRRRREQNPLRLLDCKEESCRELSRGAPSTSAFLCSGCREHYGRLQALLRSEGVAFREEPRLVRGLDYYTRTVFEVVHRERGVALSLAGGGRYDGLAEILGGPPTPACGFALGTERVLSLLPPEEEEPPQVFVALGEGAAEERVFAFARKIRARGVRAVAEVSGRSLRAQMRSAHRAKVPVTVILREEGAVLRDMESGQQEEGTEEEIARRVVERFACGEPISAGS
jgi:histidyl-tRNA synthetase